MADVLYKATDYHAREFRRCVVWNDASLSISWPIHGEPVRSRKDAEGKLLAVAESSEFERTPSVMLEAQWLGLPIVATDAGGAKESFKQDETQVYWQVCRRRRVWHRSSPFI